MDQVFIFEKTFHERLAEYLDIFTDHKDLSPSQLKRMWSYYLELVVNPNSWQAIWKISRSFCESLNIAFPTIVLVYVKEVNYIEHSALVKILAVQVDIHLPDTHWVPLIQLWPTKEQGKSLALNLEDMALALDALRFFYNNLILPWDLEEPDGVNWVTEHLEARLQLHYDMKNGTIKYATAEQIRVLITEAKRLEYKREIIEDEIQSDMEGDLHIDQEEAENVLLKIHVRLAQVKNDFELLENPLTRNVLVITPSGDTSTQNNSFRFVLTKGTASDLAKFLQEVATYYPDQEFLIAPNLNYAMQLLNISDVVILQRKTHEIKHLGMLEAGGTIRGMPDSSDTMLISQNDHVMINISGDVTLENLTLQVSAAQCGVLVRRGKLLLNNCRLVCSKTSLTSQGIIVLAGAELEMISCEMNGFSTGIVGNSEAAVSLKNCDIHSANVGLKIHDDCKLSVHNTKLRNCKEYGVCVETEIGRSQVVDFEALGRICDISAIDLEGMNNLKGNVLINHKPSLNPLRNVFAVTNRSSVSSNEDAEMTDSEDGIELNITVVENIHTI